MRQLCPHCHQAIIVNRHPFSKSMATILLKVAEQKDIGEPFHLQRDVILTKSEYANFQKLQYFGLVQKSTLGNKRRWGYWELTPFAYKIITMQATVPAWVGTFNNKVVKKAAYHMLITETWGSHEAPILWARRAEPMNQKEDKQMELNI